jgi:hypothetical protein
MATAVVNAGKGDAAFTIKEIWRQLGALGAQTFQEIITGTVPNHSK